MIQYLHMGEKSLKERTYEKNIKNSNANWYHCIGN